MIKLKTIIILICIMGLIILHGGNNYLAFTETYAEYDCKLNFKHNYFIMNWNLGIDSKKDNKLRIFSACFEIWSTPSKEDITVCAIDLPKWTNDKGYIILQTKKIKEKFIN